MKTSAVLSSLLFGSFAVAAPFDKRALVYKTETVVETVVVYTTVWDDEPVAQVTTTPAGNFYEHPKKTASSAPAKPTSQAPVVAQKPSSTYVAPVVQAPTPTPTPTPTPSPAPVVEQPKPVVEQPKPAETTKAAEPAQPTTTTSAYVAPAPAYTPAPVASAAPSTPSTGGGSGGAMQHTNVDITIYDNTGAAGACGKSITDSDMVVALAASTWGASTYDVMTGEATNPWCGQKIDIEYNGNHIQATIMDLCPGCAGADIDLSLAAWKALTKLDEKTRLKASWSKI